MNPPDSAIHHGETGNKGSALTPDYNTTVPSRRLKMTVKHSIIIHYYDQEETIMATVEELIEQYKTDPALRQEVADILADGNITLNEFFTFAANHDLSVTPFDLPFVIAEAKKRGLLH